MWTAGVTGLDRISSDFSRERFDLAPTVDKMRWACLRWYGCVLCTNDDNVRKMVVNLDVFGKRPRGRLRQRWLGTSHEGMKTVNIHLDQVKRSIEKNGVNIVLEK
ncbi:hypothetical protein V3C99_001600, partial [Haemonchus contortus]